LSPPARKLKFADGGLHVAFGTALTVAGLMLFPSIWNP